MLFRDASAAVGHRRRLMRHDWRAVKLKRTRTPSDLRRQGLAGKVLPELEAQIRRQDSERS
jgi:hypothetical protein